VCAAPPARWRRLLGTYVAISSAIVNVAAMLAVREPERVRVRACVREYVCVCVLVRVCACVSKGRQARTEYVEPLRVKVGRY
jgi:hypothetical protein